MTKSIGEKEKEKEKVKEIVKEILDVFSATSLGMESNREIIAETIAKDLSNESRISRGL